MRPPWIERAEVLTVGGVDDDVADPGEVQLGCGVGLGVGGIVEFALGGVDDDDQERMERGEEGEGEGEGEEEYRAGFRMRAL
jgi:hypothetical protein